MHTKYILVILGLVLSLSSIATPPVEEGRSIFTTRCAGCHNVNKVLTGPALAGVDQRHSIDWIINFVHSSQAVIKGGDKAAIALFEKFNKIPMPDHKDLTADNIKSVVEYIKQEASTATNEAPFKKPLKVHPAYVPLTTANYGFFISFFVMVGLLISVLLLAVHVKSLNR